MLTVPSCPTTPSTLAVVQCCSGDVGQLGAVIHVITGHNDTLVFTRQMSSWDILIHVITEEAIHQSSRDSAIQVILGLSEKLFIMGHSDACHHRHSDTSVIAGQRDTCPPETQ